MKVPHETPGWRKSSFSAQETDCVEVWRELTAVRDTKHPDGPQLRVPPGFFSTAKAGLLDR